ncbi:hypothetical protein LH427_09715 [Laribacter hongkongensis]|uniref:hypothetical protein n=1 Tax=Laribacter hongkongensis TaxID=168471 RepID=UPI001EFEE2BC|nr:hypothetical protein [Laribacter hongkongensis]MCG8993249.1 hypothetical protein [Laribacter hongkongensis]MCG8997932.1 hypothetical protein [Laribacter hongkongensis]MCG9002357.1 hypothetical protein [Laribacter hongkongensis]MCG9005667.1 hypothetical protein [Laribacter hongkongensis]MCG9008804.1 hypothetical protein [Laribacter hongkongensis]
MGIRQGKSVPTSLDEAIERQLDAAAKLGLVPKKMADLMGVEVKTYYRWLAESSMPLNRVRQFEAFCKASHISEYLCTAQGNKVVIAIPSGKKAAVIELSEVQANAADAMALLARFYQDKVGLDETVSALSRVLSQVAYHRENVLKAGEPELELFGG